MYKIRKIQFIKHPVLGDLILDFCDKSGKAADTILFAGENGTGKSTILNELYRISSHTVNSEQIVEFENEDEQFTITYKFKQQRNNSVLLFADDGKGMNVFIESKDIKNRYPFSGIFSDVDINFNANSVSTVTSLSLDVSGDSRRSTNNLPTQIKQLLIDIQALDDADIARAARKTPEVSLKDIDVEERMPRFTNAFNKMFNNMTYSHVENERGHKAILFNKFGKEISIDNLSSGEKQIVYRGCFLLKDVNAINGAFVFIDEPEISLHPNWQKKIMDYYKGIFASEQGNQTSQIFAVTHSPFVVHNDNRSNDKIIVLSRDEQGNIMVIDKPEYYKCDSVEVVQDAFMLEGFSQDKPTVYLEGRTDEMYFNKAVEIYGMDVPFRFRWVGYIADNGQEENTGKDALNKAVQFLIGRDLPIKNVCLFDCDTKRQECEKNNVYTKVIPYYENSKKMKKGIENALVLDRVDMTPFYEEKIKEGDYGDNNTIVEFKKMECCRAICSMDVEVQKDVFLNLKNVIEVLLSVYEDETNSAEDIRYNKAED